jgi:hypothetical protein
MFQHLHCQLWLGLKGHIIRYLGLLTSLLVSTPLLRQVQAPVQKSATARGKVGQENTYLAILYFACRTSILPLDTDRLGALLQKARLVHDTNPSLVSELLHHKTLQFILDLILVPLRTVQQALQRLRILLSDCLCHLPAVLALHRCQQTAKVPTRRFSRFTPSKERAESGMEILKVRGPSVQLINRHGSLPYSYGVETIIAHDYLSHKPQVRL